MGLPCTVLTDKKENGISSHMNSKTILLQQQELPLRLFLSSSLRPPTGFKQLDSVIWLCMDKTERMLVLQSSHGELLSPQLQLKNVEANSDLHTVYGWTAPPQIGGKKVEIGTLKLNGKMVTSKWGDEKMFFRHQKLDMDVKYQPGWTPYYASYKLDGKCPYEAML